MRWSGVGIDEWWRNEQFWVIGGVSSHLFAVFQGLLKVLAGIDTNFTVTSKASDEDGDFTELYMFKWTTLLIPPTTLLVINLVGVVAGVSYAINSGYQSWGPLFGKLFFAFWVIVHLYPFLKGLMGRQNRTPTIVVVWSILLASIFSLLWVRVDPFTTRVTGPDVEQCGINCWQIVAGFQKNCFGLKSKRWGITEVHDFASSSCQWTCLCMWTCFCVCEFASCAGYIYLYIYRWWKLEKWRCCLFWRIWKIRLFYFNWYM